MQDKVCGLGNVVKIKSPFKPGVEEVPLGLKDYQEWAGFELGIVTEHVQKELDGSISRVALFLFDPDLSIIYLGNDGCPFPLDYSVLTVRPFWIGFLNYPRWNQCFRAFVIG